MSRLPLPSLPRRFTLSSPLVIYPLFLPAGLGLLGQVVWALGWSDRTASTWAVGLLALGTLLICLEQAHMAVVDLRQIHLVKQQTPDPRLRHFYWITLSTIAIELIGFYVATPWLGWGALIVLLSQAWFNLLANIQLHPATPQPIRSWGIRDRLPVLVADGVGLLLASLWIAQIVPIWGASLLLSIVLIYGWVKYIQPRIQPQ
ncbi:MAG TPA: hypothetical protein V6D29_16080 [Leptolyngbyaceae cyanobacterium]